MPFANDLAKLAYEATANALAAQVATVDNARARFGVLLGGGNVATAFLAKDAIAPGLPAGEEPHFAFLVGNGRAHVQAHLPLRLLALLLGLPLAGA
jgi:hypothetical protein